MAEVKEAPMSTTEGAMNAFNRIVVAADFSESSRQAFRVTCWLVREGATRVFVLHVVEPRYVAAEPVYFGQQSIRYVPVPREPAELEALKKQMPEQYPPDRALDVEYLTREGETAEEILHFGESIGCDLIVMGTHGRTGVRRLLTGSISEAVMRQARCPVLALRCLGSTVEALRAQVILHPTDFSECSESALQVVRCLARDQAARLVVLHVTPNEGLIDGTVVVLEDPTADWKSLEAIRERVEGPDLKYPVEVRLGQGDASSEIARVAAELACSLIVMGTQGRTGLERLFLGSVAEAVLRKSACPVLMVKAPHPAPAPAPDQLAKCEEEA
jgi:nucleotide-binding universal stress UspA family protein